MTEQKYWCQLLMVVEETGDDRLEMANECSNFEINKCSRY